MGRTISRSALLAIAILSGAAFSIRAQETRPSGGIGGLLVAPTRLVLGARTRGAELTLVNRSEATMTYRLALVNKRMTEQGELEDISAAEVGRFTAERLVAFAPRQVTLLPGETQKVRFLVRRPAGLEAGEYRSHLVIQPDVPAAAPAEAEAPERARESRVRIGVRANPALSIPVIVRQGESSAEVTMTELTLVPPGDGGGPAKVRLRLQRTGNQSTYGDVTVAYVPPAKGERQTIGVLRGVAVYTPNPTRLVEVAIDDAARLQPGGRLQVSYRTPAGELDVLMAEGEIVLPSGADGLAGAG